MSGVDRVIACLGSEGSFSHEFAKRHFGRAQFTCVEGDFGDVVEGIKTGDCTHGVIPFLNSNGGHVRPAQRMLGLNRDWLGVEGCFPHLVSHNVVITEHFKELKKLISKEQVFPQCSNWLGQWRGINCQNAQSTSSALINLLKAPVDEQRISGVICNSLAHQLYGGEILYSKIENADNTTLFLVVSKKQVDMSQEQLLICLTCNTQDCYSESISDFAKAGFPVKFTSLKGEFREEFPCFLQFENSGSIERLKLLLGHAQRHLIGGYSTKNSLSACIAAFFDKH